MLSEKGHHSQASREPGGRKGIGNFGGKPKWFPCNSVWPGREASSRHRLEDENQRAEGLA